jgi:hypothetical protein
MKEKIPLESIKRVFRELIAITFRQGNLNPETALGATKQFFDKYEVKDLDKESPDNDMLLFQYGSCNFENQKEFYLDITRQFKIKDDQDEFYQLSFTLFYDLKGLEQIKSYNSWSIASSDLTSWSELLSSTEGFTKAMESKVSYYKIELNTT